MIYRKTFMARVNNQNLFGDVTFNCCFTLTSERKINDLELTGLENVNAMQFNSSLNLYCLFYQSVVYCKQQCRIKTTSGEGKVYLLGCLLGISNILSKVLSYHAEHIFKGLSLRNDTEAESSRDHLSITPNVGFYCYNF